MNRIILILAIIFGGSEITYSQSKGEIHFDGEGIEGYPYSYHPSWTMNGITYWCDYPIKDMVKDVEIIFEGRILTDSVFLNYTGSVSTYHKIEVLKKFKGDIKSDTIEVATADGAMPVGNILQENFHYANIGDEAIFWALKYGGKFPDIFYQCYGNGCGFIKVCDKKDIQKNVYEVIEAATGQPYVEVHPNTCATQQKPKK